jgi:diaminopimelate decarboxylase
MEALKHLHPVIERFDEPFFYYDLDSLKIHLESMANILDPDIKLWYACKANPMSAILKVLRNLNFGIDFASSGELHQILNAGVKPNELIATGPSKSKKYLEHLVKNGVENIVLESLNQVLWLNEVCKEQNTKVKALLRLQLDWNEGKSVIGGDSITPFGLDHKQWKKLNPEKFQNINFVGFHIFQWGNILDLDRLAVIWEKCIVEATLLSKELNIDMDIIDLGGGLGIPYNLEDDDLDFSEVHSLLVELKNKYKLKKIWMELGRFAVANCGKYFTKITDIKTVREKNIIVTDGGINHIARPALTNQPFPCSSFRKSDSEKKLYQIHGPLCTALDFLGKFNLSRDLQVGDWLIFHKAGAYGFTESMPYFLCHGLPGEVIKYNNDIMIPRPPKNSFEWMI